MCCLVCMKKSLTENNTLIMNKELEGSHVHKILQRYRVLIQSCKSPEALETYNTGLLNLAISSLIADEKNEFISPNILNVFPLNFEVYSTEDLSRKDGLIFQALRICCHLYTEKCIPDDEIRAMSLNLFVKTLELCVKRFDYGMEAWVEICKMIHDCLIAEKSNGNVNHIVKKLISNFSKVYSNKLSKSVSERVLNLVMCMDGLNREKYLLLSQTFYSLDDVDVIKGILSHLFRKFNEPQLSPIIGEACISGIQRLISFKTQDDSFWATIIVDILEDLSILDSEEDYCRFQDHFCQKLLEIINSQAILVFIEKLAEKGHLDALILILGLEIQKASPLIDPHLLKEIVERSLDHSYRPIVISGLRLLMNEIKVFTDDERLVLFAKLFHHVIEDMPLKFQTKIQLIFSEKKFLLPENLKLLAIQNLLNMIGRQFSDGSCVLALKILSEMIRGNNEYDSMILAQPNFENFIHQLESFSQTNRHLSFKVLSAISCGVSEAMGETSNDILSRLMIEKHFYMVDSLTYQLLLVKNSGIIADLYSVINDFLTNKNSSKKMETEIISIPGYGLFYALMKLEPVYLSSANSNLIRLLMNYSILYLDYLVSSAKSFESFEQDDPEFSDSFVEYGDSDKDCQFDNQKALESARRTLWRSLTYSARLLGRAIISMNGVPDRFLSEYEALIRRILHQARHWGAVNETRKTYLEFLRYCKTKEKKKLLEKWYDEIIDSIIHDKLNSDLVDRIDGRHSGLAHTLISYIIINRDKTKRKILTRKTIDKLVNAVLKENSKNERVVQNCILSLYYVLQDSSIDPISSFELDNIAKASLETMTCGNASLKYFGINLFVLVMKQVNHKYLRVGMAKGLEDFIVSHQCLSKKLLEYLKIEQTSFYILASLKDFKLQRFGINLESSGLWIDGLFQLLSSKDWYIRTFSADVLSKIIPLSKFIKVVELVASGENYNDMNFLHAFGIFLKKTLQDDDFLSYENSSKIVFWIFDLISSHQAVKSQNFVISQYLECIETLSARYELSTKQLGMLLDEKYISENDDLEKLLYRIRIVNAKPNETRFLVNEIFNSKNPELLYGINDLREHFPNLMHRLKSKLWKHIYWVADPITLCYTNALKGLLLWIIPEDYADLILANQLLDFVCKTKGIEDEIRISMIRLSFQSALNSLEVCMDEDKSRKYEIWIEKVTKICLYRLINSEIIRACLANEISRAIDLVEVPEEREALFICLADFLLDDEKYVAEATVHSFRNIVGHPVCFHAALEHCFCRIETSVEAFFWAYRKTAPSYSLKFLVENCKYLERPMTRDLKKEFGFFKRIWARFLEDENDLPFIESIGIDFEKLESEFSCFKQFDENLSCSQKFKKYGVLKAEILRIQSRAYALQALLPEKVENLNEIVKLTEKYIK